MPPAPSRTVRMALNIGIVGLPNSGKSTLFNALTNSHAEAARYPFSTIDPNVGVVEVPDHRLLALADCIQPESVTPTQIRFVDIAGLVKGASHGEGLGNQFLEHIAECDAILHVVRCFEHEQVAHVDGSLDALRDTETVLTELALSDLDIVEAGLDRVRKVLRADPRGPEKAEEEALTAVSKVLETGNPAVDADLTDEGRVALGPYHLMTLKDVLYIANVSESDLPDGGEEAASLSASYGAERVLVISAQIEAELTELSTEDRTAFLDDLGATESGIDRLISAGYSLLGLLTFYTTANNLLQAWQLRRGSTAPDAAGRVHSDMQEGFIRAEVARSVDLIEAGGVEPLREAGKLRVEGRDYVVEDGDVIRFLFNAP